MPPVVVASPLDLCRPPEDFQFHSGVWLAHDVDMAMVADTVAPLLADTPDPDPQRRRRLAATAPGTPQLVVLGCATRLGQVSAFPWTKFVPVGGRVQHAKGGVLQFTKPGSLKRITRAFVTSANLTRGSLTNREVLVWEEAGSQKTNPTLAHDLLAAVRALTPDLSVTDRATVRALLQQLLQGLPASGPARCTADSLTVKPPLLAQVGGERPTAVDRLVIVSPPFAGDNDQQAARYLVPWARQGTQIDLYTGVEAMPEATLGAQCRPAFSTAILTALAVASGAPVRVWGVPSYGSDGARRPLHAKLYAFIRGEVATVVAGSANCTARGLGGSNRELMASQDWTRKSLDAWLEELGAIPFTGEVAVPARREEPAEVADALIDIGASFEPHSGQRVGRGRYRGVLRLRLPEQHAGLRIAYRGQPLRAGAAQEFELYETEAWLTASAGKSNRQVPIEMTGTDPYFWEVGKDNEDDEDPTLLALLRALRPTPPGASTRRGAGKPLEGKGKRADDRYTIEGQQALTLITRRRVQLRERIVDASELLTEGLFPDKIERLVANTVLGNPPSGSSALVAALREAVDEFDPEDE